MTTTPDHPQALVPLPKTPARETALPSIVRRGGDLPRVATRLLLKYNIRPVGPYVQLGTIFRVSMKW